MPPLAVNEPDLKHLAIALIFNLKPPSFVVPNVSCHTCRPPKELIWTNPSPGLHHYFRKEYAEAVDYFQKSLQLNSFQLETLLRLGYSAIQIEAWEVAASTYWKYCSYESEVSSPNVW